MVKKKGKARQDKYYHLAKETGYRARSAFKLLQLNKKHNFLQSSQVLIDLCAAPGGWLQVASEHMPTSSVIVGVDLVSIRPIPRCITIQDDITKGSCFMQLKQELNRNKADCVLHDGSPNVGKSWLQDAYSQSVLTLNALKLACDFLKKGGWFITKLFRSKDYQSLMWVFGQLFKKVHATKPQASRNESAEIFIVCQNYKCPDKIDKKFFDIRYVFEDVDSDIKSIKLDDFRTGKKKKAAGYDENRGLLYKTKLVSEYFACENPLQMLSEINMLEFDDESFTEDSLVTKEIIESVKDIKSLGRGGIRTLLKWHDKMKKRKQKNAEEIDKPEEEVDSDAEIQQQLEEVQEEESKLLKKKKKDVLKERRKLRERMGQSHHSALSHTDMELFDMSQIKSTKDLDVLADADVDQVPELMHQDNSDVESNDDETHLIDDITDESDIESSTGELDSDADDDLDVSSKEDCSNNNVEAEDLAENHNDLKISSNPLINDVLEKPDPNLFFQKDIFKKIEENADDLDEVKQAEKYYKTKLQMENNNKPRDNSKDVEAKLQAYDSGSNTEYSDSDYDIDENLNTSSNGVVDENRVEKRNLSPEELALGTAIATSKKKKSDLIDKSFNRNTFNEDEEDLPEWFVKDEKRTQPHDFIRPFISKFDIRYYRSRGIDINARTIKKIAEAKARKRKRLQKKRTKVRKQAESITDSVTMSSAEKAVQIRSLYKKSGLLNKKKEEKTLVFARPGTGKKVGRPRGVKGKFTVVDRRMKKDKRSKLKGDKKKLKSLKSKGRKKRI